MHVEANLAAGVPHDEERLLAPFGMDRQRAVGEAEAVGA